MNFKLLLNPINWAIVFLMLAIAVVGFTFINQRLNGG